MNSILDPSFQTEKLYAKSLGDSVLLCSHIYKLLIESVEDSYTVIGNKRDLNYPSSQG